MTQSMTTDGKSRRAQALVTGASSGIGAAFAQRLAREGYDLIVVARRQERLEALAERLRREEGVEVEVLVEDLVRDDDLRTVEQRLASSDSLAMLINNAGAGGYAPFLDLDPVQAEALIRLHTVAPVRLVRAALPGMVARGSGAIINVASMLAFSAGVPAAAPLPKRAVYAAAKAFMTTFTEILHGELAGTGVRVQALCPAVVRTEFHEVTGTDMSRVPPELIMEPDAVVQASLAALRLGDLICVPFLEDASSLTAARNEAFGQAMNTRRDQVAARYR